jgi:predicted nuclease of predicted toxin-antitoxin system
VRFLIDECLTIELAREAEKAGFEAHHVAHLGKTSWKDWTIRDHAIKEDFVLVTNNASDFRSLYAASDLHPGLVILVPNVVLEKQLLLFRAALKTLAELGDPINKLLQVDIVGDEITLALYDFPPGQLPPAP